MPKNTNKPAKPRSKVESMLLREARLNGEDVGAFRERVSTSIRSSVERAFIVYRDEIPTIERKAILALEVLYGIKRDRTGTIGGIVEVVTNYLALRENRRGREIDEIVNGTNATPLLEIVARMMEDANAKAGLVKPPPMPAPWFEEVTGGNSPDPAIRAKALTAHALRHTTKKKVKAARVGNGRDTRFCPLVVAAEYPEHAPAIYSALRRLV